MLTANNRLKAERTSDLLATYDELSRTIDELPDDATLGDAVPGVIGRTADVSEPRVAGATSDSGEPSFPFTGTINKVVIDIDPEAYHDPELIVRARYRKQ